MGFSIRIWGSRVQSIALSLPGPLSSGGGHHELPSCLRGTKGSWVPGPGALGRGVGGVCGRVFEMLHQHCKHTRPLKRGRALSQGEDAAESMVCVLLRPPGSFCLRSQKSQGPSSGFIQRLDPQREVLLPQVADVGGALAEGPGSHAAASHASITQAAESLVKEGPQIILQFLNEEWRHRRAKRGPTASRFKHRHCLAPEHTPFPPGRGGAHKGLSRWCRVGQPPPFLRAVDPTL